MCGHNFILLVHSQFSHCIVFRGKAVKSCCALAAEQLKAARHRDQRPAGEHNGAFGGLRVRYFPQEVMETKNRDIHQVKDHVVTAASGNKQLLANMFKK